MGVVAVYIHWISHGDNVLRLSLRKRNLNVNDSADVAEATSADIICSVNARIEDSIVPVV